MSHLDVEARLERNVEWSQAHCSWQILERIRNGDYSEIYTTYRDPYEVAISWASRDKIRTSTGEVNYPAEQEWLEQWSAWAEINNHADYLLDTNELSVKLNHFDDKHGLKEALKNQDWDVYFNHIPKDWIEHAERCVNTLPVRHTGL